MDVIIILGVIIGIIAGVVGIVAGTVQVIEYLQKRRQRDIEPNKIIESRTLSQEDMDGSDTAYLAQLRKNVTTHFDAGELQNLCFDLGVDYENLPGESKSDKAREMVEFMQRRERLHELVVMLKQRRPQGDWGTWPIPVSTTLTLPEQGIPHNLPRRGEFIGREGEKALVHEALKSRSFLVSIDGIGGIGKSTLALEVAHECLRPGQEKTAQENEASFEGFIWATAKDRELTLNDLLDVIARTLDYPGITQQPPKEKVTAIRKLLAAKNYLLIVDNFETITDDAVADFLLRLPEPSKALLTTREQKIRQAWAISIRGLNEEEALKLIRHEGRRLGLRSVVETENSVLLRLYQATGGAPLAIRWAVGQIKQKGQSLDAVLAALYEARGDIFADVFQRSWNLLTAEARQVLMVMPLFATSASLPAIEAASDMHHFALDEALGQLVEMWLVEATDELDISKRRFSIHPLTRSFAFKKLQQVSGLQDATYTRLTEYYESFAKQHGGDWYQDGFIRLEPELQNILAIILWCLDSGNPAQGLELFNNVRYFMINFGYWSEAVEYSQRAIERLSELGEEVEAASIRLWPLSWIFRHRGELDLAQSQASIGLEVAEDAGDDPLLAIAKRHLARIAYERGDLERSKSLLTEALDFIRSTGDQRYIFLLTTNLAQLALQEGQLENAQLLCEGILSDVREYGDAERLSQVLGVLGGVARRKGDFEAARTLWKEALEAMERANRQDAIADCLFALAKLDIQAGTVSEDTRATALRALKRYQRLNMQTKIAETNELLSKLPVDETAVSGYRT